MSSDNWDIVVLGCGPAATVTAIKLHHLGYRVVVLGNLRVPPVVEGVSERVYRALRQQRLAHTIDQVSDPVPRYSYWNGVESRANYERLVERAAFNRALIADLGSAHVPFRNELVLNTHHGNGEWRITTSSGNLYKSTFLVEARGRSAPQGKIDCVRGPETVSLGLQIQADNKSSQFPSARLYSVESGWIWVASFGNGGVYVQCTLSPKDRLFGRRVDKEQLVRKMLLSSESTAFLSSGSTAAGSEVARGCTPVVVNNPVDTHFIRIGDAAMAVDPLSGNGIFQSLSSALAAPAVINTLLNKPESTDLATAFYRTRIQHLFYRFCRTGRDFYQMETRWPDAPFWRERTLWPDNEPVHLQDHQILGVEYRPVINQDFVELEEVVVTRKHPMGIWRIDDKSATSILRQQSIGLPSST